MNKSQRRKLHAAINDVTSSQVATIVRQQFPRAHGSRIDQLAKAAIANAHRQVSPRLPRKIQRG
jgi:hypothetical protein